MPFLPGVKGIGDGRYVIPDSEQVFHTKLFRKLQQMSIETKSQIEQAAQEWQSMQQVYDFAVNHLKESWMQAQEDAPKWLAELRGIRMSLNAELKQIRQAIDDINEVTGGDAAVKRKESLRELVELCERLKTVQADGTLDKILVALLKNV